jgi:hypothetical protein
MYIVYIRIIFYLSLGNFLDGVCLAVGKEGLTKFLVFIIITFHLTQEAVLLGTAYGRIRDHRKTTFAESQHGTVPRQVSSTR